MIETSGRILKSSDVEMDGKYHLGLTHEEPRVVDTGQADAAMAAPQARIIENHPGHAIIEVTCACGAKVCLKCEYAGSET